MQAEVFEGRSDADFDEVIARLLAEGRAAEARQVAFLVACRQASEGRLPAGPPEAEPGGHVGAPPPAGDDDLSRGGR